jgi:hypothetical protein
LFSIKISTYSSTLCRTAARYSFSMLHLGQHSAANGSTAPERATGRALLAGGLSIVLVDGRSS